MRLNKLRAWLRGQSDTPTIGIYFGEKAATAVWLDEHDGRYHWLGSACVLYTDVVVSGKIVDKEKLAQTLQQMMQTLGLSHANAITCVPDDAVMQTLIDLPADLSDEDIEAQILVDAERYIGRNIQDVYFDFQVLKRSPVATQITLTVAHQNSIHDCCEVLAMAGIETVAVDVHTPCLARMMAKVTAQVSALVEITDHDISCYITHHGVLLYQQNEPIHTLKNLGNQPSDEQSELDQFSQFTHDVDTPKNWPNQSPLKTNFDDLTDRLSKTNASIQNDFMQPLQDNFIQKTPDIATKAQTGDYRIRFDDWVDDMAADELSFGEASANTPHIKSSDRSELAVDQMTTKILSLIKNCQTQTVLPIERLYISGTTWTKASQLAEALQAKLDILCMPMHPKYTVNHAIEDNDMEQAPMLTAAVALALTRSEGINLLPWREERRSQADAKFRQIFVSVVGLTVLVMMLIFGVIYYRLNQQQAINDEIKARISTLDDKIHQMQQLKVQLDTAQKHSEALNALSEDRQVTYRWQQLSSLIPEGVYLDEMSQAADMLSLTGKAVSTQSVSAFAHRLELSGLYTDVLVVSLQQADQAMSFTLTATQLPLDAKDMIQPANITNHNENTDVSERGNE
ncbi:pilus assembly protein PilM [Moraxella catarrhalis]|uniref:Type IV pilus biogenesis protein PilN n=1 Tax=Moraxella catarrhalis TaxID=480 RepID=A0AB36DM25_MORCA|nr:pilus assembly protein PilM [Moraxella catarrhalis]MPX29642.1 pilus assembly protein PilM [Moraxella catarrhalis]OAV24131.1 Type IV pilus biogenesis protein PilN [Moraxella catarrhalis]RKL86910.1 pilus assembly protein PilM [Moraxella catarrhalis]RKL89602.1 pilus assembly protein PilM [Moraxella catarrhalis]RKL98907.1 pilus assembly protein PilM [Moraxella catarrhalis]